MLQPTRTMAHSVSLLVLLCAAVAVRAAGPVLSLMTPSTLALETSEASISVRGTATTATQLSHVYWVNQFEQRGPGTWTEAAQGAANWVVPDVALRPGINQLTIVVVDNTNRSASLHLVVNRKGAAVPSLPIGTGFYNNHPVVYQTWKGHAVIEGDMIVPLSAPSPPTREVSSPVGRGTTAASPGVSPDGLGINYTANLWPKVSGVYQIPYIVSGSSSNLTTALNQFNQQFSGLIQFVAWSNQSNYVDIVVESGGSTEGYSNVGMVGGNTEQTMQCGSGCTVATWLHEMGHTVGLLHEHQRPDRANYLNVNLTNADLPNVPGNFTLFSYDFQTIGLYDYASVMHYCAFCFSKAGQPVLESIPAGIPLSNDSGYSAGDIDQIERLYGAAPSKVTITTNPSGLQITVDGTVYPAPQTFSFILNSTHTLSLPADPQYTNPADGSTYAFGNWNDLGARSHSITIQGGSGSLAAPATAPAVTMYEANFIRLQPFTYGSPAVSPTSAGSISANPAPTSEFDGQFYTDRTLVNLTYTANSGYDFYSWNYLPYPQADNPHSFYIQSPTTGAQALFEPTSTPVTIVGESITGPHTWNPGLVGYVDSVFNYLPGAYTGSGWAANSSHTVSVDQQQSPVTTNIYYNWNSWSDGQGISHTIMQAASGTQTISASYTPFYASYTVPPALGASGASCAGGVSTSPAGTTNPPNIFDFYRDGTSVTTTATVNPSFPMVFAGWSGSLGGSTNPQTTTIDDQFVPIGNFNLVAAPLAITSISPASAVASASGTVNLTINGTGFTSSDTYAYYNGSYRAISVISSTQFTMQLNAGDLATAGGQDIYVGNYTTVSNSTCSVGAEASFTVTATAAAPSGSAAYAGEDATTEGTWTGTYGSNGFDIINEPAQLPSYASLSLSGGTYDTWAASTTDPRALQTASGASTRIASTYYSPTTVTLNLNLTDGATHRIAFYLLDWTKTGRTESVSILDANTNAVLGTETYSNFNNGVWSIWNVSGQVVVQIKVLTGSSNALVSGVFFDPVSTASATYSGADTVSSGTWTDKFGSNGYQIINETAKLPSYAAVTLSGGTLDTWAASTTDPRALQTAPGASTRIASTYYSPTTVTLNVNLTDGKVHRIGLYLLDWTKTGRSESVSILDAISNTVLSTQTFTNFNSGEWAVWSVKGHVLIQVTVLTSASNALVSGIFFDPVPAAAYVGTDTATQGTWTGKYGSNGYDIINDATQLPSYGVLSLSGGTYLTWAASTTDSRALQTASGATSRIASTYYSPTSFNINVGLGDGNTHHVSLYLLDWGKTGRTETISVLDAVSNAVLDTETYTNFNNGTWAVWNVTGHVIVQVKNVTSASNALVSGIFFDPGS